MHTLSSKPVLSNCFCFMWSPRTHTEHTAPTKCFYIITWNNLLPAPFMRPRRIYCEITYSQKQVLCVFISVLVRCSMFFVINMVGNDCGNIDDNDYVSTHVAIIVLFSFLRWWLIPLFSLLLLLLLLLFILLWPSP